MPILLISIEPGHLTPEYRELLDSLRSDWELLITQNRVEMESVLNDIEIAIGKIPADLIVRATNLKWYQQLGTGTDWMSRHPEAGELPFILTNCSDDYGVVLAEHVMAMILACARQLPAQFDSQRRGKWEQAPFSSPDRFELRGKTLLLAGVGSIGQNIAKRAKGFEMRITGLRSNPSIPVEHVEIIFGPDDLHAAVAEADMIVNSLPLTEKTRNFFDAETISRMKSSAWFFNIGRGATVDEATLVDALKNKRIAGAGLDVFKTEPLPESSPLWKLPNVIITPHDGGNHNRRYASWVDTCFDNLDRYVHSRPLRNLVDKQAGY